MILETGRVISIEAEGLWVETIQRSVCGSCQAQKGCGQRLLATFGASASRLWVLLDGRDANQYSIGDKVQIGIPEDVIAASALFIYTVPLISLLAATMLAHQQNVTDGLSVFFALVGLILGGLVVRWHSYHIRFDNRVQPVLVEEQQTLRLAVEAT